MVRAFSIVCFTLYLILGSMTAQADSTLQQVRNRGYILCGVDEQLHGFAALNIQGDWKGLEIDYCRAISAAIFGHDRALEIVPLNAQTRFSALQSGAIDVLMRMTGQSYARERFYNLRFPQIMLIDEIGALVHRDSNFETIQDMKDTHVCVNEFSSSHDFIRDFMGQTSAQIQIRKYNSRHGAQNVFFAGQCDVYIDTRYALEAMRQTMTIHPDAYRFLAMGDSPVQLFGPVVRAGDEQWFSVVKWVMNSLIKAESLHLTQDKIQQDEWTKTDQNLYLMGHISGIGKGLDLPDDWMRRVVFSVGHYGEVFNRHLGALGISRGRNTLIEKGGILYPIPMVQ